jgi:hypothetical protein
MGAQLPARWPDGSERLSSMPNCTMDRLEGAVAGQLQRRVRWLVAWRALSPERACCTSNLILNGRVSLEVSRVFSDVEADKIIFVVLVDKISN